MSPAFSRRGTTLLGWLPGVLASVTALTLLWWFADWRAVLATLAGVPVQVLLVAFLCYLASAWARARCWQTVLPKKAPLGRVFVVIQEGYLLNNLFPFRLGELWRALIMGRTLGQPPLAILSTIVIERMYDVTLAATMLLAALPVMVRSEQMRAVAIVGLAAVGGLLLVFWALTRSRERWRRWSGPPGAQAVLQRLDQLVDGFAILSQPGQLASSLSWMALSWLCLAAQYFVLLHALAPKARVAWAFFALGAGMLGGALPSAPSGLGLYEAAVVAALALVGVTFASALSLALLIHFIHIAFSSLVGLWGIFHEEETVLAAYRRARSLVLERQQL